MLIVGMVPPGAASLYAITQPMDRCNRAGTRRADDQARTAADGKPNHPQSLGDPSDRWSGRLDGAGGARRVGEAGIRREERAVEGLGEGDVAGVVGRDVVSQRPRST